MPCVCLSHISSLRTLDSPYKCEFRNPVEQMPSHSYSLIWLLNAPFSALVTVLNCLFTSQCWGRQLAKFPSVSSDNWLGFIAYSRLIKYSLSAAIFVVELVSYNNCILFTVEEWPV
ncbi:hypothetical protein EG68_07428 [Paragonimus skrjabini miyazakii]|uniref:Uncharacterized protein n=1 Tax=Paragonimus skrjabini miyazakii TaxID=59628 RepID=A0A8S9YMC7_9TREM|nr:hypothetical protein EG68_07428 [Paragonimus skrjabini miyazakii]